MGQINATAMSDCSPT